MAFAFTDGSNLLRGDHASAAFPTDDHGANEESFKDCTTNPGHEKFIKIDDLRRTDPSLYPDVKQWDRLYNCVDRTVRIKAYLTSAHRPDTYNRSQVRYPMVDKRGTRYVRCGTGYLFNYVRVHIEAIHTHNMCEAVVEKLQEPCACFDCKKNERQPSEPKFFRYFTIITATHVIFDTQEAQNSVFEFFYDSEERKLVQCIYGVMVLGNNMKRLITDTCVVLCVTHDEGLAERLSEIASLTLGNDKEVMKWPRHFLISHPHGMSKRITFGDITGVKCIMSQCDGPSPITLKKGLKIRISCNQDNADLIKMLNLKPVENDGGVDDDDSSGDYNGDCRGDGAAAADNGSGNTNDSGCVDSNGERSDSTPPPLPDHDGRYKTFRLSSDLTISCPPFGITLQTAIRTDTRTYPWSMLTGYAWWTLPPGTQFDDDFGTHFTLPCSPENAGESTITFQLYIKSDLKDNLNISPDRDDDNDEGPQRQCFIRNVFERFLSYDYNMDSCPESSGAIFYHDAWEVLQHRNLTATHFGCGESLNRTGLVDKLIIYCNVDMNAITFIITRCLIGLSYSQD